MKKVRIARCGCACVQAVMLANQIVPEAVDLLKYAQADGQYSATALLYNMAACHREARSVISASQAAEPLIRLLCHDSWCAHNPPGTHFHTLHGAEDRF